MLPKEVWRELREQGRIVEAGLELEAEAHLAADADDPAHEPVAVSLLAAARDRHEALELSTPCGARKRVTRTFVSGK
jgi:hypothetical protein